jgi:hypothetical protein
VFLASHASQFGLLRKYQPGMSYDPDRFVDPAGFRFAVARLESIYLRQLAEETEEEQAIRDRLHFKDVIPK